MAWLRSKVLTDEQIRNVKECTAVFGVYYESLSQAYGETVTLKGLENALQNIAAKQVEAKVNAGRKSKSETQTPIH